MTAENSLYLAFMNMIGWDVMAFDVAFDGYCTTTILNVHNVLSIHSLVASRSFIMVSTRLQKVFYF